LLFGCLGAVPEQKPARSRQRFVTNKPAVLRNSLFARAREKISSVKALA
jgi:hypothetical protein